MTAALNEKPSPQDVIAEHLDADMLKAEFRGAMARLGAAVNIVTTDGPAGRAGFAATAVCSLSDSPPTVLVCINLNSSAYPAVRENAVVCVNVLASDHADLSQLFGGKTPVDQRFAAATWSTMQTGAPVLDGALVSLDCKVEKFLDGGTHEILICEVISIRSQNHGRPLVYFDRKYHSF